MTGTYDSYPKNRYTYTDGKGQGLEAHNQKTYMQFKRSRGSIKYSKYKIPIKKSITVQDAFLASMKIWRTYQECYTSCVHHEAKEQFQGL